MNLQPTLPRSGDARPQHTHTTHALHGQSLSQGKRQHRWHGHVCAASQPSSGFGTALKNFARSVQAGLPIVGLISRLATDVGGIGTDEIAYTEYTRKTLNAADQEFNTAVKGWGEKYEQLGQRKYILLFLWMARTGLGFVPTNKIAVAASRLRVTQDIEIEVERFENARTSALEIYASGDKPQGRLKEQVDIAVDSLCRLSPGLKDGEPISEEDRNLLIPIVSHAFFDVDESVVKLVTDSVSDSARAARKTANQ